MSKIVIEMEKLRDLYCGLGQYCLHLGHELAQIAPSGDIGIYAPTSTHHLLPQNLTLHPLSKIDRLFSCHLPKAKVWHAIHQDSPYEASFFKHRHYLLTIHDLNFLLEQKHGPYERFMWKRRLQKKIDRASTLVFISHFTQISVEENFKIPSHVECHVIHNGTALIPPKEAVEMPEWSERPFFFSVGTVLPKKNFHVLIKMMHSFPDYHFILAGSLYHPYAKEMQEEIVREGLDKRFHLIGLINEDQKWWFYQNCKAFFFPSLMEGFGLPVVEAMSFGKPLFLSRLTSLPEIGGPDSFYFDSFDQEDMANVVSQGLLEFDKGPRISKRLQIRSHQFSWSKVAQSYMDLYKKLI